MTSEEKNEIIEAAFQDANILSKDEAADLLLKLAGHEVPETTKAKQISKEWQITRNEILKIYSSAVSKAQIKRVAGVRNPRGAGRKSIQPPKQILVISATDDEIKFIRKNTTTRERAQIILAELM